MWVAAFVANPRAELLSHVAQIAREASQIIIDSRIQVNYWRVIELLLNSQATAVSDEAVWLDERSAPMRPHLDAYADMSSLFQLMNICSKYIRRKAIERHPSCAAGDWG